MKLILVDDSAIVRAILDQNLTQFDGVDIIASVSNGRRAIDSARLERPDAVITDTDMPEMDGFEATRILAGDLHLPVIVLTSGGESALKAKQAGAAATIEKPAVNSYTQAFFTELLATLKKVAKPSSRKSGTEAKSAFSGEGGFKVLCIGASTGGPTAVAEVLQGLGKNFPLPILYAQHLDVDSDKKMADWFNEICDNVHVKLAKDGEEAKPGTVYLAPADVHLVVDSVTSRGNPILALSKEPPERFLRPAVNKLFRSAAKHYGSSCLAVLLTGMGRDGAEGCKLICEKGGYTIAESEATCAVFGMPAAAIELGAAREVLPRYEISKKIVSLARP